MIFFDIIIFSENSLVLYIAGVIRSFHEFCSLMWLLDVRNELALTSRRYSKLKQNLSAVSFLSLWTSFEYCERTLSNTQCVRLMTFS